MTRPSAAGARTTSEAWHLGDWLGWLVKAEVLRPMPGGGCLRDPPQAVLRRTSCHRPLHVPHAGLHRVVQQRPDEIATICAGRVRTHAESVDRIARLAAA